MKTKDNIKCYGFVPDNANLRDLFSGYTTNAFLFKKYEEMMNRFGVKNDFNSSKFENVEECLLAIEYKLGHMIQYEEPSIIMASQLQLFSKYSDGVCDDRYLVINDAIYERFGEMSYDVNEIARSFSELYRISGKWSVSHLYKYLRLDNPNIRLVIQIIARIYDIWNANNVFGTEAKFDFNELWRIDDNGNCRIWNVLDELDLIEKFIATMVIKFTYASNPFLDYYPERTDFDVR